MHLPILYSRQLSGITKDIKTVGYDAPFCALQLQSDQTDAGVTGRRFRPGSHRFAYTGNMARLVRVEFKRVLYQVTSRGDRREDIYEDDLNRRRFLEIFGEVADRFNWVCHAWRQMSSYSRLLIETPCTNLSKRRSRRGVILARCRFIVLAVGFRFATLHWIESRRVSRSGYRLAFGP